MSVLWSHSSVGARRRCLPSTDGSAAAAGIVVVVVVGRRGAVVGPDGGVGDGRRLDEGAAAAACLPLRQRRTALEHDVHRLSSQGAPEGGVRKDRLNHGLTS